MLTMTADMAQHETEQPELLRFIKNQRSAKLLSDAVTRQIGLRLQSNAKFRIAR
jgi:hypothetical protein